MNLCSSKQLAASHRHFPLEVLSVCSYNFSLYIISFPTIPLNCGGHVLIF